MIQGQALDGPHGGGGDECPPISQTHNITSSTVLGTIAFGAAALETWASYAVNQVCTAFNSIALGLSIGILAMLLLVRRCSTTFDAFPIIIFLILVVCIFFAISFVMLSSNTVEGMASVAITMAFSAFIAVVVALGYVRRLVLWIRN